MLLSLLRIPLSQFPDIVPPIVNVTTTFTGASAAVVEETVAQPIESAVVGVDKMIYMKSNSANDGSYGLSISFELGTNPDVDVVNVNNRVQQALARLPPDVQRYGVTVRKRSTAILEFLQFYSEGGEHDPLFISNYVTINVLDRLARTPGVGDTLLFGRLDYSMRIWFDIDRLTSLNLVPADIIAVIQAQNVQAAVGSNRCEAHLGRDAVSAQRANPGPAGHASRSLATSLSEPIPTDHCCGFATSHASNWGLPTRTRLSRLNGAPAVSIGIYLAPGANAVNTSAAVQAALNELSVRFPSDIKAQVFYDSSSFVASTINEVEKTLCHRLRAGCGGGLYISR